MKNITSKGKKFSMAEITENIAKSKSEQGQAIRASGRLRVKEEEEIKQVKDEKPSQKGQDKEQKKIQQDIKEMINVQKSNAGTSSSSK